MTNLLPVSFLLIVTAILLWRDTFRSKISSIAAGILIFCSFVFLGTYVVIDFLTGSGIDESVLFHLSAGLDGAAFLDFWEVVASAAAYVVVTLVIAVVATRYFRADQDPSWARVRSVAALVALAGAFYLNPAVGDIRQLFSHGASTADGQKLSAPEDFILIESITLPENPKNIVYVFLESFERTYLDQDVFPGLMPNLFALESEALSFTNVNQVYGTNWTISGMTASLCGMPLIGSAGNSMSRVDKFLPGAICIGDLLDPHGYNLNYLGGASLDFAGKGIFFESHSFDSIEGREELMGVQDDPEYLSPWGIYDDALYNIGTQRFDALAATEEPFGLFLLTVDTHHPNGHLSRACDGMEYQDGSNSILNVVHCADKMAAEFIEHIRNSPAFEDTILIVASDHLAMPNTAREQLETVERRNLLMIFGNDIAPESNARAASTLDTGPTLLSLLGADVARFGYGRDLMRDAPTLSETEAPIADILVAGYDYLASLWSFAQIEQGIVMNLETERLNLGGRLIGYPALLLLDEDLEVTEIRFQFYGEHDLNEQITWMGYDQRFIWVDTCEKTSQLGLWIGEGVDDYCAVYGALGADEIGGVLLDQGAILPFKQVDDHFSDLHMTPTTKDLRLEAIERYKLFGEQNVITYQPDNVFSGQYFLRSAGFGTGESVVSNLKTAQTIELARGITVVGLNADAAPIKLAHFDTCGWHGVIHDVDNLYDDVQSTITGYNSFFGGFAVVVADSAICGEPVDFAALFENTELTRWNEIDYRNPYIGLFAGNGEVMEYVGNAETSIAVEANEFLRPVISDTQRQITDLPRIAHAGGGIDGMRYTSSIDALNLNKDSFTLFEMDLIWTTDNHLVCLHDWDNSFQRFFDTEDIGPVTLAEFENLVATHATLELCTIETLTDWLVKNDGARVITDVKDRNLDALKYIADNYPDLIDRFVPQLYQPAEYPIARSLGFSDVIWTLYRYRGTNENVLSLLRFMDLYGLVMPESTADGGLAKDALAETGVLSWVHTINTQERLDELRALGVTEIMTDTLLP